MVQAAGRHHTSLLEGDTRSPLKTDPGSGINVVSYIFLSALSAAGVLFLLVAGPLGSAKSFMSFCFAYFAEWLLPSLHWCDDGEDDEILVVLPSGLRTGRESKSQ